ncbi:MAG: succinyl-diaminopimelate desuccinylase, partial [Magnetospirillum sp.]
WSVDPFGAVIRDDRLYGRGAVDMKAAIACFVAALARHGGGKGSVSLLITGDEEGPSIDGTRKVLDWLTARGERLDSCLVGEPTGVAAVGDTMKIGRRGSLNVKLSVFGTQGHSAYPHLADNPIPRLLAVLGQLTAAPLDEGSEHFDASSLAITTIDVGNKASNVIPAEVRAGFNIRFNDRHSSQSLREHITRVASLLAGRHELSFEVSGECFLTPPGPLSAAVAEAAHAVTGLECRPSTSGGTSDARFIRHHCPVVEFGLLSAQAHKVDEHVPLADLETLTRIYQGVLGQGVLERAP